VVGWPRGAGIPRPRLESKSLEARLALKEKEGKSLIFKDKRRKKPLPGRTEAMWADRGARLSERVMVSP